MHHSVSAGHNFSSKPCKQYQVAFSKILILMQRCNKIKHRLKNQFGLNIKPASSSSLPSLWIQVTHHISSDAQFDLLSSNLGHLPTIKELLCCLTIVKDKSICSENRFNVDFKLHGISTILESIETLHLQDNQEKQRVEKPSEQQNVHQNSSSSILSLNYCRLL